MVRRLISLALVVSFVPLAAWADDPPWIARSKSGMVASDSTDASQIGADILSAGGNAFDAAVATSLALAVTRPQSTGLGGGGFVVVYVAKSERVFCLDFRECAPAGATAARYVELNKNRGDGPSPSVYGGNAVAVPGQLSGLAEMHKRFGTQTWKQLTEPAAKLAETGFTADEFYADECRSALAAYTKWPKLKSECGALYTTLLGNGTPPKVGDKVVRPDLAKTLGLIGDKGADVFYKGPIGEALVKATQAAGGTLTMADLADYQVRDRTALRATYRSFDIYTMPPPSSGGVCLVEILNILRAASVRSDLNPREDRPHVLVEAMKHAFADRAHFLGDPDFAAVPVDRLTSLKYATERAQFIKPHETLTPREYGAPANPAPDRGTSHFCITDKDGNVVAQTETINGVFGSLVMAEPYGIVLNNEMDDFTADPGQPNLYGLIQGEANAILPRKRPLSSMTPTIVFRDVHPVLVLGGSGGPRIITSVLQVLLNVIEADMPLDQAVTTVRIHHQWQPDEVTFDRDPPEKLAEALKAAGHKINPARKCGIVQAIRLLPDGTMVGASDPHKGGHPAGVK